MSGYALPIKRLIGELSKLPGVGEKTATRLATHILRSSLEDVRRLAGSLLEVKETIRLCARCFHLSEGELCDICRDASRDTGTICVVEEPDSVIAIEESGSYRGTYHVLHGVLSPLDGIGPEHLRIRELVRRAGDPSVREVVLATNPSVPGETTALFVMKLLQESPVRVTRIALGVPVGGDLKYTDRMTLAKSFEFRRDVVR